MKSRIILNAIAILGFAVNNSATFADGGHEAPTNSTISDTSTVDPVTLQAAEQLLNSKAIGKNEDGNFVLDKSIVDTLRAQGRFSEAKAGGPGSICD